MHTFRIHTNWTNTVSEIHILTLDDLLDAGKRQILKDVMCDPERLRPGKTRQALTEEAAEKFATLARDLRAKGYEADRVAHFVNRLVFCMFAEDENRKKGIGCAGDCDTIVIHKIFKPAACSASQKSLFFSDLSGKWRRGWA
ncbi:hypothetical protein [Thalassospira profundimaris]|uniref:hypothetical protein n=1 Tax=Thalassospira profundimaris TaxID=502049 RepID=UPI000287223D|nr:hypothetical protein TH2_05093 [Thalassospira profundimaris WP0211]